MCLLSTTSKKGENFLALFAYVSRSSLSHLFSSFSSLLFAVRLKHPGCKYIDEYAVDRAGNNGRNGTCHRDRECHTYKKPQECAPCSRYPRARRCGNQEAHECSIEQAIDNHFCGQLSSGCIFGEQEADYSENETKSRCYRYSFKHLFPPDSKVLKLCNGPVLEKHFSLAAFPAIPTGRCRRKLSLVTVSFGSLVLFEVHVAPPCSKALDSRFPHLGRRAIHSRVFDSVWGDP